MGAGGSGGGLFSTGLAQLAANQEAADQISAQLIARGEDENTNDFNRMFITNSTAYKQKQKNSVLDDKVAEESRNAQIAALQRGSSDVTGSGASDTMTRKKKASLLARDVNTGSLLS